LEFEVQLTQRMRKGDLCRVTQGVPWRKKKSATDVSKQQRERELSKESRHRLKLVGPTKRPPKGWQMDEENLELPRLGHKKGA